MPSDPYSDLPGEGETPACRNILLVEDEAIIALSEATMLRQEGYQVELAFSGREAIARVNAASAEISLILMDIDLGPGLDGTQAAQIILQNHEIPIIFLSVHTEPEIVAKTEKITSYGYVDKSTGAAVLVASIKMAFKLHSAYQAVRRAEAKFRAVVENSNDGILLADSELRVSYRSPAFTRINGFTNEERLGRTAFETVHPDDLTAVHGYWEKVVQNPGKVIFAEYRVRRKDGSARWVETHALNLTNNPDVGEIVVNSRDITERKQAEDRIVALLEEKQILLKEVHHRIRNNMSTIASLLNLQAECQPDMSTKIALQEAAGRIQSMMVLYDKLYRSEDFNAISLQEYIPTLLKEVVALFPELSPVKIATEIDPIVLPPKILSPLGIILTELVTNTMKYAFPDHREGLICVKAARKDQHLTITFADNGVGLPDSFAIERTHGFGMQLVRLLVRQIGGLITFDGKCGAHVVIYLNLADPVGD